MEELLAEELKSLGANNVQVLKRAVSFSADKEFMYKSCLWLRTALRIIKPIAEFQAEDEHQLYREIQKIDWSQYLDKEGTLAVDSTVNSNIFRHSKYVALKTKDAIVDQFRDKFDVRPSVHVSSPDLRINLKISNKGPEAILTSLLALSILATIEVPPLAVPVRKIFVLFI